MVIFNPSWSMHANFKKCMCIPKWDHAKAVKQMRWFDRLLMVLYFTDIMGKMVAMCQKTSDKYFCINFWPCKEICMRNKYMTETQCLGGSTIHSLVTFLKTKVTSDYWVVSAFHWRMGNWIVAWYKIVYFLLLILVMFVSLINPDWNIVLSSMDNWWLLQ